MNKMAESDNYSQAILACISILVHFRDSASTVSLYQTGLNDAIVELEEYYADVTHLDDSEFDFNEERRKAAIDWDVNEYIRKFGGREDEGY